ncbi:PLD nuclease N-terminal domain-containing protein [Sphaerimonospora thailandensis]|nr:PLD nuclease N-terminal domain-containing protein [Sphaerimonospora thailandensis]
MPSVVIGLALLAFWLYCLFDVITTPEQAVRNLPKVLWVLIVVFLAGLGGLFWLILGRPTAAPAAVREPRETFGPLGGRGTARAQAPRGPEDDPEFLRHLERRLREED